MFRCSECGAEFDIKPDYCDCGNDTFEEVVIKKEEPKEEKPLTTLEESTKEQIPIKKTESKNEKKSYYDYSYWDSIKKFFDPISTIIFLLCTMLSLYIIFYAWNPTETEPVSQKSNQVQPVKTNIPSIDKLWNDTPPAPVVKEEKPVVEEVEKIVVPLKKVEPKKIVQPVKKTEVKKQEKPKAVAQSKTTQKTTPATTTKTTTATKSATTTTSAASSSATVQKPVQKVVNKQELSNYKIALRNRIASRINFANVVGDGSCVVSFTVTSSGQLTNKKFQKQSDNFSLNDVVYNALMKTTSFNPPPSGYNGETLRLTVKMNDGNFEVTLY